MEIARLIIKTGGVIIAILSLAFIIYCVNSTKANRIKQISG